MYIHFQVKVDSKVKAKVDVTCKGKLKLM